MRTLEHVLEVFKDSHVTDVCINGASQIYIDRGENRELLPWENQSATLQNSLVELLGSIGKCWDARNPFVDAILPQGLRLHAVFPPISPQGVLISLRRLPKPGELNQTRWQSPLFSKLQEIVQKGESLLISGATGAGKTTLANDLLGSVSERERILALEDTPELSPKHPHFISLTTRVPNADGHGEVTLRTLLKQALRMRPDRIVLGECRGAEVLDLLQAINTGHEGALTTIHANSCRDALRRLELLCLLSVHSGFSVATLRELIASGIRWIAHVKRLEEGRKIVELSEVVGREGDTILLRTVVKP